MPLKPTATRTLGNETKDTVIALTQLKYGKSISGLNRENYWCSSNCFMAWEGSL